MMDDPAPIHAACGLLDVSADDLWIDYVALGGNQSLRDVRDFLDGLHPVTEIDYDRLVQALNDRFIDQDMDHPLLYASEIAEG